MIAWLRPAFTVLARQAPSHLSKMAHIKTDSCGEMVFVVKMTVNFVKIRPQHIGWVWAPPARPDEI
jgi:hypothetical protein